MWVGEDFLFLFIHVRTACDIGGAERAKLTWNKLMEKDCREWKLTTVDPQERSTWRSQRSAMHAASQLPGRGPSDVDPIMMTMK